MDENGSITGFIDAEPGSYQFTVVAKHTDYKSCLRQNGVLMAVSVGPVSGVMTVNEYEIPVTIVVE